MGAMKDSGLEWIGEIPKDWNTLRCKYISKFINGYAFDSKDFVLEFNYPVVRIGDIKEGKIDFESCQGVISNQGLQDYIIKEQDILIAMSGATVGKVGISTKNTNAYINQRVGIIRTKFPKYLYYLLSTKEFMEYILLMANGSAQPNVSGMVYGNYKIPYPHLKEQEKIANFLDEKCEEIDTLYSDIEKQIETLEDYKKSVITETVTKGLDKNAEMKWSGIEWIGEIPKHWTTPKVLYVLQQQITDGPHTTPEFFDEGIPFISAEAVSCGNGKIDFEHIRGYVSESFYQECCKKYTPQINDIYMIKSGATTGRVAIVDTNRIFTIWSPLAVFRCNINKVSPQYMFYYLQSSCFQNQVQDSWSFGTQQNIGMRTLEHLKVVIPLIKEQEEIVNFLDKKCKEIDNAVKVKKEQLEVLEQYKKSLIYEYVTGKKEVEA